jgi:hypothetical protein
VRQTLSRAVRDYKVPSPAAIAAAQLEKEGKFLRPGQTVAFIYTLGEPGARAWDVAEAFDPRTINIPAYKILLNRAMTNFLQSFGMEKGKQMVIPITAAIQKSHPRIFTNARTVAPHS